MKNQAEKLSEAEGCVNCTAQLCSTSLPGCADASTAYAPFARTELMGWPDACLHAVALLDNQSQGCTTCTV